MDFDVFSGSVPGPYHVKNNLPNQDAYDFFEEDGVSGVALADGAGSLKHSDVGAKDAVDISLSYMKAVQGSGFYSSPVFNSDVHKELVEHGVEVASSYLTIRDDYKEYGSTLCLVSWDKNGSGSVSVVGDSFVVIHHEDGSHSLVTGNPHGEYANTTELISTEGYTPVTKTFENVKAVSLSSDGLESVAIQYGEAHKGFWDGVLSQIQQGVFDVDKMFRWLDSLDKIVDDTTLVTIVRK